MTKPNPVAAIWLSMTSILMFTTMSAIVHEASKAAPVGQIVFWRSALALVPIVAYMAIRGQFGQSLRTKYPHKHLIRGLLGTGVMFLNFTALAHLSVGIATALMYLAPILSILAAMVFLRERPSAVILGGMALGFAGIILMLYPSLVGAELRDGALIGIASGIGMAALNALSRVQVKDLTRTDPPASIALFFAVLSTLAGLATLAFGWAALDGWTLALLVAAGLLGGVAHVLMMEAVARAPVSLLAPFEYSGIVWAFIFDLFVLRLPVGPLAAGGALVVVSAAALVAYGEGRFGRARRAVA